MTKSLTTRRRRAVACLLALASLTLACARKPKDVRITPAKTTIYGLKRSTVLAAAVVDTKGKEFAGPVITWSSDRPAVATVDEHGVVTAVSPGRTSVKAAHEGIVGSCTVEVVDAATLTVAPLRMTLAGPPGTKGAFHSEVKDTKGGVVTAHPRWTTSDPKVATVDNQGIVTAVGSGRVTISATLGDLGNAADLIVTPRQLAQFDANPKTLILRVGDAQQVTPVALDEAGKEIADPAVEWISTDPKTAKVENGRVTGLAPGSTTIRATAATRSADVSVLVN